MQGEPAFRDVGSGEAAPGGHIGGLLSTVVTIMERELGAVLPKASSASIEN